MKRVIIVDDSQLARIMTRRCLEIAGCQEVKFIEASNGQEALTCIKTDTPDLLVTDLNMPVMGGLELLKRISSSPMLFGLPVFVITSSTNSVVSQELIESGALAVIVKPVSPAKIADALSPIFTGWEETNEQGK